MGPCNQGDSVGCRERRREGGGEEGRADQSDIVSMAPWREKEGGFRLKEMARKDVMNLKRQTREGAVEKSPRAQFTR